MIKKTSLIFCALFLSFLSFAQEIEFTEYDLDNGLHVILHRDNTAPVVSVRVMYHGGAKTEAPGSSGFAHFFEHLLFGWTDNTLNAEWLSIDTGPGMQDTANINQVR